MPGLPSLTGREVVKVFEGFGGQVAPRRGSHVILVKEGSSVRQRIGEGAPSCDLMEDLSGPYPRRRTVEPRLVYQVLEEEHVVKIRAYVDPLRLRACQAVAERETKAKGAASNRMASPFGDRDHFLKQSTGRDKVRGRVLPLRAWWFVSN